MSDKPTIHPNIYAEFNPNSAKMLQTLHSIVEVECEKRGVATDGSYDEMCADMIKAGQDTHPDWKDFYQFMCSASNIWENIVDNEGGLK